MSEELLADGPFASLRTTASHTIGVPHLVELLRAVPEHAPAEAYKAAVIDDNVLGRPTLAGRQRTFRHLRELYLLDPNQPIFRVFRYLWDADDVDTRPLIAGIQAFIRDEVLRASWAPLKYAEPGQIVSSAMLSGSCAAQFGTQMSPETIGKCGRNTGACWTQTGHLVGRAKKLRQVVNASPAAIAYAAYLGYLAGKRGFGVLDTAWAEILDLEASGETQETALRRAHSAGFLNLQIAGDVVAITFTRLERVAISSDTGWGLAK